MKFSRAVSRVRWFSFLESNVSETISVLVLRVVELVWVRWTTQSFYLCLSKLCSQGRPFAAGDLRAGSLPALPGSAFWYPIMSMLASMLIIGYRARLRLKPSSLLKFFLFSLMWMASFMTWSMYPDVLSKVVMLVCLVPCVHTVLCHHRLLRLVKAYVPHMSLAPGLNGSSRLSHVYLPTLTWNLVHTWDFKTQVVLAQDLYVIYMFSAFQ
jgi:hypothetical protein